MASVAHASEREAHASALAAVLRVLWIDDDPDLMKVCADHLRSLGCLVEFVEDGVAGLAAALQQVHDVIILDWNLPKLSGAEVLTRLRADGCQTPVVVLTGYGTEDIAFNCGRLGAVAYLAKPILGAALYDAIKTVVHESVAPNPFISPTCERLARAVVAAIDLPDDPRTFDMWARVPVVTEDGLHRWCKLLDVDGRDILAFARILRAVVLIELHRITFAEVMDIAAPKTLERLLATAGLSPDQAPLSVHLRGFLDQQHLVTHAGLLRCIVELLRQRREGEGSR